MRTELFDYALPERLIAVRPLPERDGARLLVLDGDSARDARVRDWPELVPEGALVVLNETRVRRARVLGSRQGSGGRVELLFVARLERDGETELWEALGRANKPLREGTLIRAEALEATIVATGERGLVRLRVRAGEDVESWLARHGEVPIPPYLGRAPEPLDDERYQTVFAEQLGSVAAPTAGLHLGRRALERLRARDVELATLTLAIGPGTFRPVVADDLDRHEMHEEAVEIAAAVAERIESARTRGAPVVAVGTTVVRALETAADAERTGRIRPFSGRTRLLIQPGYRFRVVDALLTNFHQPKSTLLALVAAFAGRETVLAAYGEAVRRDYRFLSYGDAMWIPRRAC